MTCIIYAGSERISWPSKHQVFSLLKHFRHRSLNILHKNFSSTHIQNIQQIKSTHAMLILLLFCLDRDNMQIPQKESRYRRQYCVGKCITMNTQTRHWRLNLPQKPWWDRGSRVLLNVFSQYTDHHQDAIKHCILYSNTLLFFCLFLSFLVNEVHCMNKKDLVFKKKKKKGFKNSF